MWGRAFVDFRAVSGPLAPSLARGGPRRGPAWPLSSGQGRVRRAAAGGWPGPGRLPSHVLPVDSAVPPPRAVSLLTQPGTRVLLSLSSARREQGSARPLPSCTPSAWERAGVQWVLGKCMSANPPGSKVCVLRPATPFWVTVAQRCVSGIAEVALPVLLCAEAFSAGLADTAGLPDSVTVRPPLRPAAALALALQRRALRQTLPAGQAVSVPTAPFRLRSAKTVACECTRVAVCR